MTDYGPSFAAPAKELAASPMGGPELASAPAGGHGVTLELAGGMPTSVLRVPIVAADPEAAFIQDGMVWVRSDTNQLRWREGGVTYQVTGTAV